MQWPEDEAEEELINGQWGELGAGERKIMQAEGENEGSLGEGGAKASTQ